VDTYEDRLFSCAIVSVPERKNYAANLAKKIPYAKIFTDVQKKGSWYGHKEAMLMYEKGVTHHLVLEEDVTLCTNFTQTVNNIIKTVPDKIISLFNFSYYSKGTNRARKQNRHFFSRDGSTGQAILFPIGKMLSWIRWCDHNIPETVRFEDTRLWTWLTYTNQTLWVCQPNIVDHLCPNNSTLNFNNKKHISPDFQGVDVDCSTIDWAKNIHLVPDQPEVKIDYSGFWEKEYPEILDLLNQK
jgi:GR25 family glycosyltransferase involved in LPS biosynthesis